MDRLICQHKGCDSTDVVHCVLYDPETHQDLDFYYCVEHCQEEGFCYGCGNFWAGCEDFDFSPSGLCSNCREADDVMTEEDEWLAMQDGCPEEWEDYI
jgi:hypothetical protein